VGARGRQSLLYGRGSDWGFRIVRSYVAHQAHYPTLRRRIHCAIYGFKSEIWIQLKPPRKDATVNHNSLQKDGVPWKP
jgi:hypothetical protein